MKKLNNCSEYYDKNNLKLELDEALKELGVNDGMGNWYPLDKLTNADGTKLIHPIEKLIKQALIVSDNNE